MKRPTTSAERRAAKRAAENRRKAIWKGTCIVHKVGRELAFFGITTAVVMKLPEIATNLWIHLTAFTVSTWSQILTVIGLA